MIATCLLLAFMLVATVTDIRDHSIYNWTTYPGIIIALIIAGIATGFQQQDWSVVGIDGSVYGLLLCSAVMLACFLFFEIGGGDVKLLAMVGAFLGPSMGIEAILWTFVIGAAKAVIILIWKLGASNLAKRVIQQLMFRLNLGNFDDLTEEEKKQLQIPLYLAPSALMAVIIVRFSLVNHLLST